MDAVAVLVNQLAVRDEAGQDLIEYALLVALIAIVAITGAAALGNVVQNVLWRFVASAVSAI